MADELTKLKNARTGDNIVLGGDSLSPASTEKKGAVKQGAGVAKDTYQETLADKRINNILSSLRQSGVIANDKFVVFYDKNFPQGVGEGGNFPIDENVYLSGQTATVKFEDSDERVPYCQGHNFLGWSLSSSAVTPDYPYDENDPQTYTVTFTDNDIILYAVWALRTCTLTFALGAFGTGSVPSPISVEEGQEVEIPLSPTPTEIGGAPRDFIGWSLSDGYDSWTAVEYRGGDRISLYDDITVYPVFAAQYTLSYALGNDATGTVPGSMAYYNGYRAHISFNASVTCISDPSKVFIGWSTTDESSFAQFSPSGITEIYMNHNVTLYPVFALQGIDYITIANNHPNGVNVNHGGSSELYIAAGSQNDFIFTVGENYEIEGEGKSFDATAYFTGVYNGTQYSEVPLNVVTKIVHDPEDASSWEFSNGDNGKIMINEYSGS